MISVVCTLLWLSTVQQISIGSRTGPTTPRPSDFAQCRLSDELKEQFVDFHNKFRGEVQPSAADMEFLEWNDDLGNLAQMWSDKCEWMHGFTKFGAWYPNQIFRSKSVGQNLAREWGKWIENKEAGPEDSVRRWFIEKNYYTFGKFAYPMPSWMCRKEPCGHYTQVVWAKSKQVGCAFRWCDKYFGMAHPWVPGETVVTCDYYPSGNVVGQRPYTPGTPCTKCASGQGWCYKNLCNDRIYCTFTNEIGGLLVTNSGTQKTGSRYIEVSTRDKLGTTHAHAYNWRESTKSSTVAQSPSISRECKNFSPKCGTTYTSSMCLTKRDLMEKKCPQMCNLCRCPLQCKNGGQVDRKTCTCTCYGKWKGADCSERICDQGWYGENCEKRCFDKVGTDTCKWRVQNGHPCSVGYMKMDCVKTCVCDLLPKPKPKPTIPPKVTARPVTTHATPSTGEVCKDEHHSTAQCEGWVKNGFCKKGAKYFTWMRENCMKSCGVCTCQDVHNTASCKQWAQNEECKKNPVWMEVNCPRSCLICDCHDKNTKCGEFVKSGYCVNKYAVWMKENCQKSCNKCT